VCQTSLGSISDAKVWNHIVITFDEPSNYEIRIYINGALEKSCSVFTTIGIPDAALEIGRVDDINGGTDWTMNGAVDEFAVWDSTLSEEEIQEIYNNNRATSLINDAGNYDSSEYLTGYWRMDEDSNSTTLKNEVSAQDGILENGSSIIEE